MGLPVNSYVMNFLTVYNSKIFPKFCKFTKCALHAFRVAFTNFLPEGMGHFPEQRLFNKSFEHVQLIYLLISITYLSFWTIQDIFIVNVFNSNSVL